MSKGSKSYTQLAGSVASALAQPLTSAALEYGLKQLPGFSQQFWGSAAPSGNQVPPGKKHGPLMPNGKFKSGQGRPRRRRRGRGGRQRAGSTRMNQSMADAPVSFSSAVCMRESDFKITPIRTKSYGPGVSCAFCAAIAYLGSNGVTTTNTADYQNAIAGLNSYGAGLAPSGFISADGNWTSGLLLHPGYLGTRMSRESNNWSFWQPRRVTYSYQNQLATSNTGSFTFSFTKDPDDFIEAALPQSAPVHSFSNLTQNLPNCTTNVYKDMALTIGNFDKNKYYPTEVTTGAPFTASQAVATLAYNSSHYAGRFVALYAGPAQSYPQAGILWVSGVIDFMGPSSSQISIGTSTTSLSLSRNTTPIYFRGAWRTLQDLAKFHRRRRDEVKQEVEKYDLSFLEYEGPMRVTSSSSSSSSSSSLSISEPSRHITDDWSD